MIAPLRLRDAMRPDGMDFLGGHRGYTCLRGRVVRWWMWAGSMPAEGRRISRRSRGKRRMVRTRSHRAVPGRGVEQ